VDATPIVKEMISPSVILVHFLVKNFLKRWNSDQVDKSTSGADLPYYMQK
jgi:hypothetical protein